MTRASDLNHLLILKGKTVRTNKSLDLFRYCTHNRKNKT